MVGLTKARQEKYDELRRQATNTPLVKYEGNLPNNNTLYIKRVCDGLSNTHYGLVDVDLLEYYESNGFISPGWIVYDNTSGSAGIGLCVAARALGYKAYIGVPKGLEEARLKVMRELGANIIETDDPEQYVNGFMALTPRFLHEHKGEIFYLNHSLGDPRYGTDEYGMNRITLNAMSRMATESIEEMDRQGKRIDYAIIALGNGCSYVGTGRVFAEQGIKNIGIEPFQSALVYNKMYPGRYQKEFGMAPGTLPAHHLLGMSFHMKGVQVPTPTYTYAIDMGNLRPEKVVLISDRFMDLSYLREMEKQGKAVSEDSLRTLARLPHWDVEHYRDVGRSTDAGVQTGKKLAETVEDANMVIIGYDREDRYVDLPQLSEEERVALERIARFARN